MRRTLAAVFAVTFLTVLALATSSAATTVRQEAAGHACDFFYSIWWDDGALSSVSLQFDDREHNAPVEINGTVYAPDTFMRTDGVVWMRTASVPNTDTINITSGDCTETISIAYAGEYPAPVEEPLLTPMPEYAPPAMDELDARTEQLPARTSAPNPSRVLPTR